MSIYVGNTKIGQIFLGSTEIAEAYLGSAKVYQKLPYDAQVEYLESNGTQYIDTGVKITSDFSCELRSAYLSGNANYSTILGCTDDDADGYGYILAMYGGKRIARIGSSGDVYGYTSTTLSTTTTTFKNNTVTIYDNGTSGTSSTNGYAPNYSLYMFARNYKGNARGLSSAKIYYCKIYDNDILIRDFIPVRVGTTGYMYDKVSGQLFGNAGSGSFVLGNDV